MYELISFVLLLGIGILLLSAFLFYPVSPQGSLDNLFDDDLIIFLQKYIQINTSHPHPHYKEALNFLKKNSEADGFSYQEIKLPSGGTVAVISYLGSDEKLPTLLLNHHLDVVPAEAEQWTHKPFAGAIKDGRIIGRGAQDMKGIGAVHYGALRKMKLQGIKLRRTIHLAAVPDEELGGFTGTKEFIASAAFERLNVGFVLDEGHASGDAHALDIKVAERKVVQIKIVGEGEASHGSLLQSSNAIHQLVEVLFGFVAIHNEQRKKIGATQAGELLSCNITSLIAGARKKDGSANLNVIPKIAQATVDIRIPPAYKQEEIIQFFHTQISKIAGVNFTILAQSNEECAMHNFQGTMLYGALKNAIEYFNLQARPHFFEASSDLRFYWARGLEGVGLTPFTCKDTIHKNDEFVPIDQLIFGRDLFFHFLKDFCL